MSLAMLDHTILQCQNYIFFQLHTDCSRKPTHIQQLQLAINTLSGKKKKKLFKQKTFGLAWVTYEDHTSEVLAAVSGTGQNEWTRNPTSINNDFFAGLKAELLERRITLAPLQLCHPVRRILDGNSGPFLPSQSPERKEFVDAYIARLRNKASTLVDAGLSRQELEAAVRSSNFYYSNMSQADFDTCVQYYDDLAHKAGFLDQSCNCQSMQLMTDDLSLFHRTILLSHMPQRFRNIEQQVDNYHPPPTVQTIIDKIIKPLDIPELLLAMIISALGFDLSQFSATLTNLSVRCAEDNALAMLTTRVQEKGRIASIEWVAMQFDKHDTVIYMKPCPFCAMVFPYLARNLNLLHQQEGLHAPECLGGGGGGADGDPDEADEADTI